MRPGPSRRPTLQRLVDHIDTSGSGCWPWTGSRTARGYGRFNRGDDEPETTAHRALLEEILERPLSDLEWALHHCDNPPCCRPSHLYVGSPSRNQLDAYQRGCQPARDHRGYRNPRALLDSDAVAEIRTAPRRRGVRKELAEKFGVSVAAIGDVRGGRSWSDDGVMRG